MQSTNSSMGEKKSIAIIGASNMAVAFAKKARQKDIYTHCFAWEDGAVAKDYVDEFHPISIFEKEAILDICRKADVGGVVSTTELTIPIAAYIAEEMGLVSMGYALSQTITNKNWVREQTRECKTIKNPKTCLVNALNFDSALNEWTAFPAIVKPISEGGKRGVIVAKKKEDLRDALLYSAKYDKKKMGVLIEEYIGGNREYSVESLSFQGRHEIVQITEKISSGPPHCVELGHHQPADITRDTKARVATAIREVLDTVGFRNGPTHTEIKINADGIWLIELNARPGGDHIAPTLTFLSTGYDYLGETIEIALGNAPAKLPNTEGRYSGIYFVTKQTSYLKKTFDACDNEAWLYEKHLESDELTDLSHNDCMHTNYMIYCSDKRINLECGEN